MHHMNIYTNFTNITNKMILSMFKVMPNTLHEPAAMLYVMLKGHYINSIDRCYMVVCIAPLAGGYSEVLSA